MESSLTFSSSESGMPKYPLSRLALRNAYIIRLNRGRHIRRTGRPRTTGGVARSPARHNFLFSLLLLALDWGDCLLGQTARRRQREIQEPVPVGVYLPRHRLLIGAVFARNLRRLLIARPLGQALEELVGCYLHVLGHEAVSCVLARLVCASHVPRALKERGTYPTDCLGRRGARPHGIESLAQPPLVLFGLLLVVLEHLGDLGIVGGGDHRGEHRRDVLLHGMGVLDVLDQLLLQLVVWYASYLLVGVWFPSLTRSYPRTSPMKTAGFHNLGITTTRRTEAPPEDSEERVSFSTAPRFSAA